VGVKWAELYQLFVAANTRQIRQMLK